MQTINTLDTIKSSIMSLFKFEGQEVRVLDMNGAPWWVLPDVCGVLEIRNPRDAAARLDEDEKGVAITDTLGGRQETTVINESGLWSLVLTSRKAAAKRFKKWVTAEVIPSIRKTGGYSVQSALPKTYAEALLEAGRLAQERDKLTEEKKALEPKVAALDRLASLEGVHNLRSAAQQCGWPERKFINRLIELGWLYTHSVTGRKCAYADKIKAGLMESKNVEVKRSGYVEGVGQPMITQKGLVKIRTIIGDVPDDDTTLAAGLARKATPRPFAHRSGATPT